MSTNQSRNTVERQIGDFIAARFRPQLRVPAFDDQTPLFSSGIIDSFGVLELIAFLEDTFQIDVNPARHELTDFDNVDRIAALVRHSAGTAFER
jgi:acyl carrier protein